ncbi:MAG: hypothetical protein SWX82_33910 [Cyanobacteriota bacterium]|nr:hypothetical protein [Cyanobacteriota bacterium]
MNQIKNKLRKKEEERRKKEEGRGKKEEVDIFRVFTQMILI